MEVKTKGWITGNKEGCYGNQGVGKNACEVILKSTRQDGGVAEDQTVSLPCYPRMILLETGCDTQIAVKIQLCNLPVT